MSLLTPVPVASRPDLVGPPVAAFLDGWEHTGRVTVAEIDPSYADTAAFCERYEFDPVESANCVVVGGSRGGEERIAACMVRADMRADVNTVVRKLLDVRKASFLAMDDAVTRTGMEYGGITPVGLPPEWRIVVDAAAAEIPLCLIGSGVRHSKLLLPGRLLGLLPGAEVVEGMAR